jgi:hypothetical protein
MKAIPNTSGYFADKEGNIYSLRPKGRSKAPRTSPHKLTPQTQSNGYVSVSLMINKKQTTFHVHILVLTTFIGERPMGYVGCHGKNGKKDNSLNNLYWGTQSQNNKEDKIRDGSFMFGDVHPNSVLKSSDIIEIRNHHKMGLSNRDIAKIYKVTHSNISKIIRGHTWTHAR